MRHGNCVRRLLFIFVLLMFPLSVLAQAEETASPVPAPTGPYIVGTTSRYFIDETRDELNTVDRDDKRELMVQFWYPAGANEELTPAPYIPDSEVMIPAFNRVFARVTGIDLALDLETFASFQSHAFPNLPVSNDLPSYPVLIFSPGYTGIPVFWTAQLEEMASHGYIVVGINHTYSSAVTLFPDGRAVELSASEHPRLLHIVAEDQIFVANQLQILAENDPESMFTGRLNLEQLGVFGQSLGGSAAILTCALDTRFQACASEDGAVEDQIISDGLDQPFMFLSADDHPDLPDRFYERLSGPTHTVIMEGFRHIDFSDLPLWSEMTPLVEANLIGSHDRLRTVQIINAYLLAFFNQYLAGEDEPLLDGPSVDYPEADLRSRNV